MVKNCETCKYEYNDGHNQPCRDCGTLYESYTMWEQKEQTVNVIDLIRSDVEVLRKKYEEVNNPRGDAWEYTNPYGKVLKIIDKYTKEEKEIEYEDPCEVV